MLAMTWRNGNLRLWLVQPLWKTVWRMVPQLVKQVRSDMDSGPHFTDGKTRHRTINCPHLT